MRFGHTRRGMLGAASFLALWGCNRSRRRVIGVVPKATSHLFFVSVHAGVEKAGKEFDLEVLWNGPNDETDHTRQIQIVDAMVARRVDAIAISATDERALVAPVERAMKAGIPVTVFDSGVNVKGYVTFVATDNYGAGCVGARELGRLTGGKGKAAIIMQKPGGESTGLREKGFEETLRKEFPDVRIAARQFGMSDPARSRAAAENILTAHPDLNGMFASAEASSIGAIHAIRARGLSGSVKLVTFDWSDTHRQGIEDGTVDVMLVQDPYRIGYEAVKSLAEHLAGRPPQQRLDLPARVIVKSDLDKPDIRALLFPDLGAH